MKTLYNNLFFYICFVAVFLQKVATLSEDVANARTVVAAANNCSISVQDGFMNMMFFAEHWDVYKREHSPASMEKFVLDKFQNTVRSR